MSRLKSVHGFARIFGVLFLVLVLWLNLAPEPLPDRATASPGIVALAHIVMHFTVTAFILIGWHDRARILIPALLIGAIGVESAQVLIAGREFTISDMIGNVLGTCLGGAFFLSLRSFSRTVLR